MNILPKTPSKLIRLALKDLASVARDRRYLVDMSIWHSGKVWSHDQCVVCLAGSVMARSLGANIGSRKLPVQFPDNFSQLCALNLFRSGDVRVGIRTLCIDCPAGLRDRSVPRYSPEDPQPFRRAMFRMARRLESLGL